ncbi:MAG: GGDEF domain-containing protein [Thiolinea sp.]
MPNLKNYAGQFDQLPMSLAQEQLTFLQRYGFIHFWLHSLSAILLSAVLWRKDSINGLLLFIWLLVIILLAGSSWFFNQRFASVRTLAYERMLQTVHYYRYSILMLCTLWGVSGIILFTGEWPLLAVHLMLLLIVSLAILPNVVLSRQEFYLQLTVLFLPMAIMLLAQPVLQLKVVGVLMLLFGLIQALTAESIVRLLNHLFTTRQNLLEQVHTDPVTQLVNRSHFDQVLKTEWQRAARYGQPLSLLLIEVNNFQAIEIRSGLQAADQYLRVISHCLKAVLRRGSDILARYGHAEFVALLPDTEAGHALRLAQRFRAEVDNAELGVLDQSGLRVSVSIGVSTCVPRIHLDASDYGGNRAADGVLYPAMLLSAADRALQRARQQGTPVEHESCKNTQIEKVSSTEHSNG